MAEFTDPEKELVMEMARDWRERKERRTFARMVKDDFGLKEFIIGIILGIIFIGIPLGCLLSGTFLDVTTWFVRGK